MSIILGIDASQSVASCAIGNDDGVVASAIMEKPIENFPKLIRKILSDSNKSIQEIDEIVVCIGPGSQMGTRTAVVTGNALALALNKPISGVLSTDAAAVASSNKTQTVAVSAGRRRWFVRNYIYENEIIMADGDVDLVDEVPENVLPSFYNLDSSDNTAINCAEGALLVAINQRHLIVQNMLSEVRAYD